MIGLELALEFNAVSYTLIALLVGILVLPVVFAKDPDIHPYALLRQSTVAPSVLFALASNRDCSNCFVSVSGTPRSPPFTGLCTLLSATLWSRALDFQVR